MLLDALAVISFCYYERLEAKEVSKTLKTFEGAKRRFTEYPVLDNIVIDDYAHHPAEIRATLKAVNQKYPDKKTVVVFSPHTYSRTKAFKDDYIDVLSKVDKACIMDIYGARENQEDFDITSEDLIKEIPNSESISKDQIDKLLGAHNSVIIFMSPNDITDMEKAYIEKYQNQAN